MEKLPDPFNMQEIIGKVEERTPYVIVAFQVSLDLSWWIILKTGQGLKDHYLS